MRFETLDLWQIQWIMKDEAKEPHYLALLAAARETEATSSDHDEILHAYMTAWSYRPRRAEALYYFIQWLERVGELELASDFRAMWRRTPIPRYEKLGVDPECYFKGRVSK